MGKEVDLKGKTIGFLKVIERSDKRGPRGKRTVPLWKCECKCGNITYKATDTLTNDDVSMCEECARKYSISKMYEGAQFIDGTQVSKITNIKRESTNMSGVKGVYLEKKTGKYRARIRFWGKTYNFGSHDTIEEAKEARIKGEELVFGEFLKTHNIKVV